jgi:hypothetical protein
MTERTASEIEHENVYLRKRVAQLQSDIVDITAENSRLREERERLHQRQVAKPPNPLSSGQ